MGWPSKALARQVPVATRLAEPLSLSGSRCRWGGRPRRTAWAYDSALRTVWGQPAPNLTSLSEAEPVGMQKMGERLVLSHVSVAPGSFEGFVNLFGVACVNVRGSEGLLRGPFARVWTHVRGV